MARVNTDDRHLDRLRTYFRSNGAFPSMNRLTEVVGLTSSASVFGLVARLIDSGFLKRTPDRALAPGHRFFERALLSGTVRAGLPEEARDDEPYEVLTIDDYLVEQPHRTVLVRVKGESMKDAGLLDGDICIVERAAPANPGDIVVAIVDDEMTIKTLARDTVGRFYLVAANPEFGPIIPEGSLELFGLVTGSFRRFRR